jgi:hypothetical protein
MNFWMKDGFFARIEQMRGMDDEQDNTWIFDRSAG